MSQDIDEHSAHEDNEPVIHKLCSFIGIFIINVFGDISRNILVNAYSSLEIFGFGAISGRK